MKVWQAVEQLLELDQDCDLVVVTEDKYNRDELEREVGKIELVQRRTGAPYVRMDAR